MTPETLFRPLAGQPFITVPAATWNRVAHAVDVVERHDTMVAGELLIVRWSAGLAAVEHPNATQVVVRRLVDRDAARAFVNQRLDQYERMWDGCGCKIDYFAAN